MGFSQGDPEGGVGQACRRLRYGQARRGLQSASLRAAAHTPVDAARQGLKVRGLEFRLFYPRPRSSESVANARYGENRITFRPHFTFGESRQEIDFVFFLNGLPVVALEVKHEKNQNVHDAVAQFAARDHSYRIFQHPFLYLAADTSDVMAATDPSRKENFRWHNSGLTNQPITKDGKEYPVEFLYREVLSREHLLEALSFFLVRVPKREAEAIAEGYSVDVATSIISYEIECQILISDQSVFYNHKSRHDPISRFVLSAGPPVHRRRSRSPHAKGSMIKFCEHTGFPAGRDREDRIFPGPRFILSARSRGCSDPGRRLLRPDRP